MSNLYDPLFGDAAVTRIFSPAQTIQAMLDVEAALTASLAQAGVIPSSAVAAVEQRANASLFDVAAIAEEAASAGNLAIPLVRHLTKHVAAVDAEAAKFIHLGATSQDVIDTALALQLQKALPAIAANLDRAVDAAVSHARQHIDAVMPGRTWLQQATPITFGLKAAGWADALDRRRESMRRIREDVRVLQFGGASGTLAALGHHGLQVSQFLAQRLGLRVPDLPWHAHRDRLAVVAGSLGVTCGTCGKIATDIALMAQTEVGEATVTRASGSSTMPHKRNPLDASVAIAASVRAPGLVATILAAMPQEHERGLGGWQAEWTAMPDLVQVSAGAARATADALENLWFNSRRARENVSLSGGLAMAEAVAIALASSVGKSEAHHLVERATARAIESNQSLEQVLLGDPNVTANLRPAQIKACLEPDSYLGSTRVFVENVLRRLSPRP